MSNWLIKLLDDVFYYIDEQLDKSIEIHEQRKKKERDDKLKKALDDYNNKQHGPDDPFGIPWE